MTERSGYIAVGSEQVYVVRHEPAGDVRANVVIAGPMGLERTHSYATLVRVARLLVRSGYRVFRFDYRGIGESTGKFSQATFDGWRDDLGAIVTEARSAGGPVFVIGLRLGALLGHALHGTGEIDALIAWEPPADGTAMMMEILRRKLAADLTEQSGARRRTRDDYVAELHSGQLVEVEGYPWSGGLFDSAKPFRCARPSAPTRSWACIHTDGRPRDDQAGTVFSVAIPKPVFWAQSTIMLPNLDALFERTLSLLEAFAPLPVERPTASPSAASQQPRGGNRSVFEVQGSERLVGTAHLPARLTGARGANLGFLFLNAGYVPRDGHGGLAAHAADALAEAGVAAFRVDLPALGDSGGSLPERAQQFFERVTSGADVEIALQVAEELRARHGLDGVVLGGLCGGAVTAAFAAERAPKVIKGLILLEPEMYLTEPGREPDEAESESWTARLPLKKLRKKVFSYWGWMRLLTFENRYGRYLPLPRKRILELVLNRSKLPSVTNRKLAASWRNVIASGLPVLVITAEGKLREIFLDRINDIVLKGMAREHLEHVRLRQTNHTFTSGGAIEAVVGHVSAWSRRLLG